MRIIGQVIDNVFSSIRLIFMLGFGAIVLLGLVVTYGTSVIAPQAVDAAAERAERLGMKELEARRAREREYHLGREGWGYEDSARGSGSTYESTGDEYVGGWGDDS